MKIRLLRGQIVIREDLASETAQFTSIVIPELGTWEERQEKRKFHVGKVLQKGPPALTKKGAEVPQEFEEGDTVIFHFNHHEKSWTRPWLDGDMAVWVPQVAVDAVVTP